MAVNDPPVLTVLLPMYQAVDTIVEAARSILEDPVEGLELLIIDDGCTDDSAIRVEALGDPRIRLLSQPNRGLVATLNRGLDEARGEFLARMDADDLSVPGRLAAQLDWLRARPDAVACGTGYELFGDFSGRVRMPRSDRACRARLTVASCHCGASIMLRRSAIEAAGLRFDPAFTDAEDYEFFTRLAALGRIGNLPMVGYRYRIHDAQVSTRRADAQRGAHLRIVAAYGAAHGRRAPGPETVTDLLWPSRPSVLGAAAQSAAAAARTWATDPSIELVCFGGRKVMEAALKARAAGRV